MRLEVDQFLLHIKAQRNFSAHTIRAYEGDLAAFLAYAAANNANKPSDINRLLMRGYIAMVNERKPARNTLLRKISSVRSFTAYLMAMGKLETDPFDLITIPKREKRLPRFMTEGEVGKIQDSNSPEQVDAEEKNVIEIVSAKARPLAACRKDKALSEVEKTLR